MLTGINSIYFFLVNFIQQLTIIKQNTKYYKFEPFCF